MKYPRSTGRKARCAVAANSTTNAPASEPDLLKNCRMPNGHRPASSVQAHGLSDEKLAPDLPARSRSMFRLVNKTGHRQVFGLTGMSALPGGIAGFLLAVTSHSDKAEQCATHKASNGGGGSCLPLRGSPGFAPGSLLRCTLPQWVEAHRQQKQYIQIMHFVSTKKHQRPIIFFHEKIFDLISLV